MSAKQRAKVNTFPLLSKKSYVLSLFMHFLLEAAISWTKVKEQLQVS